MDLELKEEDRTKIMDYVYEAKDNGTHLAGQSYEDGLEAVIDLMEGNLTVEEITETIN